MSLAPPYLPSILIDQVIAALGAFLTPFIPVGCPIIRGQQNRTPPPVTDGQADPLAFVKLQEIMMADIETPTMLYGDLQATINTPTRIDIQVSFYGVSAGDYCKGFKAVYRSFYAPDQFPVGIAPLYCSNGSQGPLITGEEQYENRWDITASLQYNPIVTIPQQSATTLKVNIFEDIP
jgi:hypothetical protein